MEKTLHQPFQSNGRDTQTLYTLKKWNKALQIVYQVQVSMISHHFKFKQKNTNSCVTVLNYNGNGHDIFLEWLQFGFLCRETWRIDKPVSDVCFRLSLLCSLDTSCFWRHCIKCYHNLCLKKSLYIKNNLIPK